MLQEFFPEHDAILKNPEDIPGDTSDVLGEQGVLRDAEQVLRRTGSAALTGYFEQGSAPTPLQQLIESLPVDQPGGIGIYTDNIN